MCLPANKLLPIVVLKAKHLSSEELFQPLWISLSAAVQQAMSLELPPKPLLWENQCFIILRFFIAESEGHLKFPVWRNVNG